VGPAPNAISRLLRPDPYRELFRLLADATPEAVLVLTSDGHGVLAANHAFLLLTGYARSDITGLRPAALFPESAAKGPGADPQRLGSVDVE
jgi:PAS domain-containing protein